MDYAVIEVVLRAVKQIFFEGDNKKSKSKNLNAEVAAVSQRMRRKTSAGLI